MTFTLLLGPPGSGKSTVIRTAKSQGVNAIDLEDFGGGMEGTAQRTEVAKNLIQENTESGIMLVGMADVDPSLFPDDSIEIMLLPSFEVYKERLQVRDESEPHKQGQGGLEYKYDSFKKQSEEFEHVLGDEPSPEETLSQILKLTSQNPNT